MNGHPQFDEDLDLYVLGALEGEEKQALEIHVRGCAECQSKLREARGRVALLALAAPPVAPPTQTKQRLLRRLRAQVEGQPSPVLGLWRPPWAVSALALAGVLLLLTAGYLIVENRRLNNLVQELQTAMRRQEVETARARAVLEVMTAPDTVQLTLVSGSARPLPQGKVFYHARKGLLFYAAHLPVLPSHQTYQLWLVPAAGNPISAGIFAADVQGDAAVLLPPLPSGIKAKAFAVTVEPAGGVPQPTGPKVLIGVIS